VQSILTFRDRDHKRSIVQIVRHTRDFSPLVTLFFRDGSASFLLLFAAMTVNTLFTVTSVGPFEQMGIPWIMATDAVIGSRLFLNLGGYLYRSPPSSPESCNYELKIPATQMARSTMQFQFRSTVLTTSSAIMDCDDSLWQSNSEPGSSSSFKTTGSRIGTPAADERVWDEGEEAVEFGVGTFGMGLRIRINVDGGRAETAVIPGLE